MPIKEQNHKDLLGWDPLDTLLVLDLIKLKEGNSHYGIQVILQNLLQQLNLIQEVEFFIHFGMNNLRFFIYPVREILV